jgi:hypothetical protein
MPFDRSEDYAARSAGGGFILIMHKPPDSGSDLETFLLEVLDFTGSSLPSPANNEGSRMCCRRKIDRTRALQTEIPTTDELIRIFRHAGGWPELDPIPEAEHEFPDTTFAGQK